MVIRISGYEEFSPLSRMIVDFKFRIGDKVKCHSYEDYTGRVLELLHKSDGNYVNVRFTHNYDRRQDEISDEYDEDSLEAYEE